MRKILLFILVALCFSCKEKPKPQEPVDMDQYNYEKVSAISRSALKAKETETDLDFGLKFGMTTKEVKKTLAVFLQKDNGDDIFYTVEVEGIKYSTSIEPTYRNGSLYSLQISYLAKVPDSPLDAKDGIFLWQHYMSKIVDGRKYKTFNYGQYGQYGDTICLAYKDNMLCEIKSIKGHDGLNVTFTNKAAERKPKVVGFAGEYYCSQTGDTYHFDDDGTGWFRIQGKCVNKSKFKWTRKKDSRIRITYIGDDADLGSTTLLYVPDTKVVFEKSESFGTLGFERKSD